MKKYPDDPGYKEETTSKAAAESMSEPANVLRKQLQDGYEAGWLKTSDECAQALGVSILSIRPRVSELRAKGIICPSGMKHRNRSGKMAHVWMRTPRNQTLKQMDLSV